MTARVYYSSAILQQLAKNSRKHSKLMPLHLAEGLCLEEKENKLKEILRKIKIKYRYIRSNLYWNQTSAMRVQGKLSKNIMIKKGVRQECVMLFNKYSEKIFKELLEEEMLN